MQEKFTSHGLSDPSPKQSVAVAVKKMIICIFLISIALPLYAQKSSISVSLSNVSVKEVFETIKKESGYSFWYRENEINLQERVSVSAKNESVLTILNKILANQKLAAKIEGKHIVIFLPVAKNSSKQITGSIVSSEGMAVVGASVIVKGTTQGTTTDINGKFALLVQPNQTLQVSFIGYTPQEVAIGNRTQIQITLEDDVRQIDNVVVIGYGSVKKVNLTGAISVMDMSKQENQPLANASSALHTIPGLYVNQASSKPGNDAATIRIRGVGTLSGCSPLVLVDGMEYSLSDINPENIATITVLKDASASIYGSKAANGVILITTKTGQKGAPKLYVSANVGFQVPTYLPDVVTDPIQYMEMRNRAVINDGSMIGDYSLAEINEYKEGMKHDKYIYPSSNWYDICYDTGLIQQYNARLSGGTDVVTYSIAAGFMDQQGIFINNDAAKRYSWDLKLSVKASKRLTIGANILGNYREDTEPCYTTKTTASTISRALPIMSGILPGGEYGSSWLSTPGRNNYENPLMQLYEGGIQRKNQRFIGQLTLAYQLPFGIKYNANFGYEKIDRYAKDNIPAMYTYNPKTMEKKNFNSHVPRVKDYDTNGLNITFYNTLSWDKTLNDAHTLSAMIGSEYKRYNGRAFQAYAEGFFNNQLTDLDAASTYYKSTGRSSVQILSSYFARVGYNYKEKYMIDATARYDGSSKFAKGNQWSFFPSVSFGWRLDKENFMQNIKALDLLKIRGSWGKMGNQAIGDYEYLMSVVAGSGSNYSFGDTTAPGAAITDFVDPSISWETTTSYDLGLDLGMFNNRLTFSADIYKKRTSGILRTVDIPAQVGNLNGPMKNIGIVDNDGVEIVASWRDKRGDFTYSVGGSFAYNRNMVIDLKGEEMSSTFRMTKAGYPINSWWLYQANGYYQTPEEVSNSVTMSNKVKPGYIKLVNQNGDEILDTKDKVISGNSVPSITYAFDVSAGWKGLELSAQFQGVADVYAYLSGNIAAPFWNGAGVTKDWATDTWSPENPHAKLPLLTTATGSKDMFNGAPNTHWLYDASYLRLKSLQLTYTLPKKWLSKLHIEKAQVFVNGHNLFTFSPMDLFDPEKDILSTNIMEYPSLKTYNFGFNFIF